MLLAAALLVGCGTDDRRVVTRPRPDPRVATLERTVDELRAEVARLNTELVKANLDQQDRGCAG